MNGKKNVIKFGLYAVLALIAVYTLFPIYFLFVNSFKNQKEIVAAPMSLPAAWNFDYLKNAASQIHLVESASNTILITVVAVTLIVLVASVTAWMMVRSKSKASDVLFLVFTAAMLIPFQSVMYPLVSLMEGLGLKNTFGLILMYGGFGLSMTVFMYHGFFKGVPLSLEEAAVIDGANIFQLFFHIVFPLVKPITATVIITNAMWIWNDYLLPFLIIGNNKSKTLTLSLYYAKSLSGQYGNPWELIFPAVLICVIPILVIFIFLQKNIIEGIAAGAVKG
ncbi:MAG: carbohydrate ABC transporter permease [Enterocloster asparagiformis]|nr:carbohydrate ABC transporter permease [Enterocloster asparagiformis]